MRVSGTLSWGWSRCDVMPLPEVPPVPAASATRPNSSPLKESYDPCSVVQVTELWSLLSCLTAATPCPITETHRGSVTTLFPCFRSRARLLTPSLAPRGGEWVHGAHCYNMVSGGANGHL